MNSRSASVPVFRSLVKKGVPLPAAVTFMLSAPVINPVVMLSTFYAYGGNVRMMLARMGFGVVCSLIIGLLFSRNKQAILTDPTSAAITCACGLHHDHAGETIGTQCADPACQGNHHHHHHSPEQPNEHSVEHKDIDSDHHMTTPQQHTHVRLPQKWLPKLHHGFVALITHFTEEFFEVAKFLLIGIAVSTVIQLVIHTMGQVLTDPQYFPQGCFSPSRQLMTCCVADLFTIGFKCQYEYTDTLTDGEWISVTGKLTMVDMEEYQELQLIVDTVEPCDPPLEPYVYAY